MTKKKRNPIKIILVLICVAVLAYALVRIGSQMLEYRAEEESIEKAIEIAKRPEPAETENDVQSISPDTTLLPADPNKDFLLNLDIKSLQTENPDVKGWILIPGTEISFPLMQTKDNAYYLKHSWDNKENSCGSIFYDYRSTPQDWNPVIYGHNMRNGSMFADLLKYKEDDFCKDNNRLLILVDGEVKEYEFAAAFEANLTGVPYMFGDLSGQEKDQFADELSKRAGREYTRFDTFTSLSTCTGFGHNTRWVVVFCSESKDPHIQYLNGGLSIS